MKLTVVISEGPYTHEASDTAYHLVQAAIKKGHEIKGIFFYNDGVYNVTRFMEPPRTTGILPNDGCNWAGKALILLSALPPGSDEVLSTRFRQTTSGFPAWVSWPR